MKTNILLLGEFPRQNHIGGSPISNMEIKNYLIRNGFAVTALAPIFTNEKQLKDTEGVVFLETRFGRSKMFGDIICKYDFARKVLRFVLASDTRPDVMFLDNYSYFCRFFRGIPKILSLHGSNQYQRPQSPSSILKSPYAHLCAITESRHERQALHDPSLISIITNSERSKRKLIDDYGLPDTIAGKIVVAPRGVDVERFGVGKLTKEMCREKLRTQLGIHDQGIVLIFVGGISPHKGQYELVTILPKLVAASPEVVLVLVGKDGGDAEQVRQFIADSHLEDHAHIVPTLSDLDLGIFLKGSDIYVSAATEGFGINQVEGMSMGLPIIAFDKGALGELFKDGEQGFLVKTPDAFIAAVTQLAKDETLRKRMGAAAERHAETKYTWQAFHEILKKALAESLS